MASLRTVQHYGDTEYQDLMLVCSNRQFKVHRIVIGPACPWVKDAARNSARENDFVVVPISNVDPTTLHHVIEYCYLSSYAETNDIVLPPLSSGFDSFVGSHTLDMLELDEHASSPAKIDYNSPRGRSSPGSIESPSEAGFNSHNGLEDLGNDCPIAGSDIITLDQLFTQCSKADKIERAWLHLKVHDAASKFRMTPLEELSLSRFESEVIGSWNLTGFVDLIQSAFKLSRQQLNAAPMCSRLADESADHIQELLRDKHFGAELRQNAHLGYLILRALFERPAQDRSNTSIMATKSRMKTPSTPSLTAVGDLPASVASALGKPVMADTSTATATTEPTHGAATHTKSPPSRFGPDPASMNFTFRAKASSADTQAPDFLGDRAERGSDTPKHFTFGINQEAVKEDSKHVNKVTVDVAQFKQQIIEHNEQLEYQRDKSFTVECELQDAEEKIRELTEKLESKQQLESANADLRVENKKLLEDNKALKAERQSTHHKEVLPWVTVARDQQPFCYSHEALTALSIKNPMNNSAAQETSWTNKKKKKQAKGHTGSENITALNRQAILPRSAPLITFQPAINPFSFQPPAHPTNERGSARMPVLPSSPSTRDKNVEQGRRAMEKMAAEKDRKIAFLEKQLSSVRLADANGYGNAGPRTSNNARADYNSALRSVNNDHKACPSCLVPFYGQFRGAPVDERDKHLILKCGKCTDEVARWSLP